MTIRTPARFIGRTRYRAHDPAPPASAFFGPRATDTHSQGMADMLAQIAVTFGGAIHLATIQQANGRWLSITTN